MKIYISIILLVLLTGCSFYAYGVHKDDPQLIYQPPYEYEFQSILCELPKIGITHLEQRGLYGDYKSMIYFASPNFATNTKILSVVLEHRDTNNRLIEPKLIEWPGLPIKAPTRSRWCYYFEKTYAKADLPKEIIETIRVEFKVGDETKILEYRFLLEYKKSHTVLDNLMSV